MSSKVDLRLDWCAHEAARYAVTHWHYSRSLPPTPHNRVGVWEDGKFIGAVLFSRGANMNIGRAFDLAPTEVCELTRMALTRHVTPVSRIVAIAIRFLARRSAGVQLIVSYADPEEGHHGGIYQAGGWIYLGQTGGSVEYIGPDGKRWHSRMISKTGRNRVYGELRKVWRPDQCTPVQKAGKHKYVLPLDDGIKERLQPLAKPYPKRAKQAMAGPPAQRQGSTDPHAPQMPS